PLQDRFGIPIRLNFYEIEDLKTIVQRGAKLTGLAVTDEAACEIAMRSRGTPRIAGRLLRRVRDFAEVAHAKTITREIADAALLRLAIDKMGFDQLDLRYLTMIARNFGGGPVGIET
ncbi:Holliday junction branch migration DNA helicase RuvB, partial [Candidatus Liberibacter asiaticus]